MKPNRRNFLLTSTGGVACLAMPCSLEAKESKPKIKIGQIGTGHPHAAGKMAALRKLPELFDVVGVVETDPKLRKQAEANKVYANLKWLTEDQLLGLDGLTAVAVETEVANLVSTAARCIQANKHVHLDKPGGAAHDEYRTMRLLAEDKHRVVQMGYMFRYNTAFEQVYYAAKNGWLGELFEGHGVISKKISKSSRDALAKQPGGAMYELGCHLIDSLIYLFGMPKKITPFTHKGRDGLLDNMLAVFEFESATATIRSSVNEPQGFRRRQFTVVGNQGVADIRPLEPPKLELLLEKPYGKFVRGVNHIELSKPVGRYDGEFRDLAAVLHGEKEFEWSAKHDVAVHAAVLEASGL